MEINKENGLNNGHKQMPTSAFEMMQTLKEKTAEPDMVNHPKHYGGKDNQYEAIKVINAWKLNFNLGSVLKYISRAGKKDPSKLVEDLEKAQFYLNNEIEEIRGQLNG